MKGRQLENAAALGLSPDARASQADLATAALEQGQAAVRLGPHSALLREGDEGGGEGAVMSGRQWAQPQWAHRHFVQEEGLVYSVWLN